MSGTVRGVTDLLRGLLRDGGRLALVVVVLLVTSAAAVPPEGTAADAPAAAQRPEVDAPVLSVENPRGPRTGTDGRPVDAHDGELLQLQDGSFLLVGTAYRCGFRLGDASTPWCGVQAWSSRDLRAWTPEGPLFDASTDVWQDRCARGTFGCFRPHVVRSPATGRWVLWVNGYSTGRGEYHVLSAEDPAGPYREEPAPTLALRVDDGGRGDHALFVDPATGRGYVVYTLIGDRGLHDLAVEELDPTLTTGTGRAVRLGLDFVEAPDLFRAVDGRYHLVFSDPACPYCAAGLGHAVAPTPLGPWTARGRVHPDSCGGQPAAVTPVRRAGRPDLLVFSSDRWVDGLGNQAEAGWVMTPLHVDGGGDVRLECRDGWQAGPSRRVARAG